MARPKRGAKGDEKRPLWDSDKDNEINAEDLNLSSSDDDFSEDEANEEEIQDAVLEYMNTARRHHKRQSKKPSTEDSEDADDDADSEEEEEDSEEDDDVPGGYDDDSSEELNPTNNSAQDDTSDDEDNQEEEEETAEQIQDDPASDSSEDERPNKNTVGAVPLEWYDDEEHIGYDAEGRQIIKKGRRDALERHLARSDSAKEYRTIYDEYNDEEIVLSKEEMKMIQRIRTGQFPHSDIDPFEPENDWFSRDQEIMPLSGAPEPKRRFIPSKWEEKKVVKLVRALRKGWLKRDAPEEKPDVYMMWQDDGQVGEKTSTGLTYIPAPKLKLPGHEESYNPPPEYIPDDDDDNENGGLHKPRFQQKALRLVPAYSDFIKERFERCLDLYLCPRARIQRLHIDDPESLVPKLPKPKDLQPFPTILSLKFLGHKGPVRSLSPDPTGHWLLSGSMDGTVKLWEVRTGRCQRTWNLNEVISCVAWCPNPQLQLAAVACGSRVVLLPLDHNGNEKIGEATEHALRAALDAHHNSTAENGENKKEGAGALSEWKLCDTISMTDNDSSAKKTTNGTLSAVEITQKFPIKHISWHARGDYFCSVAPTGNTKAVLVHQLSRGTSQNPFRKNRGRVVRAMFHPTKPFFFVATQQAVRVYNLAKQALAKKLLGGSGVITSMDVHPSGDHLIVGAEDNRLCWYDLDLSTKPYRALRYHNQALRGAAFHPSYPLFASSSDDATVHVFHGMVYADLLTNPLIVPVKILRGHTRVDAEGVLDVKFHPKQPWVFTAGADAVICLFVNP